VEDTENERAVEAHECLPAEYRWKSRSNPSVSNSKFQSKRGEPISTRLDDVIAKMALSGRSLLGVVNAVKVDQTFFIDKKIAKVNIYKEAYYFCKSLASNVSRRLVKLIALKKMNLT
jgi:hypothetical protein